MDTFSQQTQGFYLSLEDAEHLTNRRLPHQLLGTSTSSLEVFEEELEGQLVVVKRFRIGENHSPSLEKIMAALVEWKHVSSHPNIMPFLGLCSEGPGSLPVLVTPRPRWDLLQYIATHPDTPKHALAYSIATALEYIHGQDVPITHGNVKAGNILVDHDGVVYLSDIGIFQAVSPGPRALVNELRWSAPEKYLYQAEHTPSCDTWSFGMTVIEMHTGLSPFDYYHIERVVIAMSMGEEPFRPGNLTDDRLWHIVERCLRYAARDRPSMELVSKALSLIR